MREVACAWCPLLLLASGGARAVGVLAEHQAIEAAAGVADLCVHAGEIRGDTCVRLDCKKSG